MLADPDTRVQGAKPSYLTPAPPIAIFTADNPIRYIANNPSIHRKQPKLTKIRFLASKRCPNENIRSGSARAIF